MAPDDHERLARIALTYLTASGDQHIHQQVTTDGAVATYQQTIQVGHGWQRTAHVRRARIALRADTCRSIIPGDPDWPTTLDRLADLTAHTGTGDGRHAPPLALWVTGTADLSTLLHRAVTITGSRAATAYGHHVTTDITTGCAQDGWTVVAGGNFGIDAAAHRAALAADTPTIVIVPGGLDRLHPAAHHPLFDRISTRGLLISEAPPGTEVTRRRFIARQRLLAAVTAGTVLVEAAARTTYPFAAIAAAVALGRPAMAVPGPVTSAQSTGCHLMLRDPRVHLVTNATDVLTHLR
ncbi:DNA-processing protein DprA [Actinoplanes xinjiangensis]|uniref:DNA-processing protein DprA n=1 Tax=Actinoplanes xinjiangensis TaxID=512350 RepID=UPI0034483681